MSRVLFVILFIACCYILKGQEEQKNPIALAFKPQYGFILPHSGKVEHLTHTNPYGLELEYAWNMLKKKNWRQCNCYSKTGVSFLYVNYDNPDIVGSSYNIVAFAEPYLIKRSWFLCSARMGVGISLLDKIYDENTNPENTFFSTTLSYIIHMDLNAYFRFNEQYSLTAYAKYNHISNGGVKQPNYGMNFPMFGLGLVYYPKGKLVFPEHEKDEFKSEMFYNLYIFGMFKKVREDTNYPEKTTYVYGLYGLVGRTVGVLNGFSIGTEYLNDGAVKEEIRRANQNADHQSFSGLIGHHLLFGKFDFSQYWGTYIYAPNRSRAFYQRYTLTYKFTDYILGGITLKAHGDAADSFHAVLGWAF